MKSIQFPIMGLVTFLIVLVITGIFSLSSGYECEEKRTLYQLWDKKLQEDLSARENIRHEPPNGCNITDVKIEFVMKAFQLDDAEDLFTMHSWARLIWTDKRLAWNTTDYGGVEKLIYLIRHFNFWYPDVQVINRDSDVYYYDSYSSNGCKLNSTGYVVCASRSQETVQCVTKLKDWPYDTQRCSIEYGVVKQKERVTLVKDKKAVIMITAAYGPEWTIVGYDQEDNASDTTHLKMTFVLERQGDALAAIVIFPTVMLSILTISTFLLDVKDRNRLFMTIFSVTCHFFHLSVLNIVIPKHSDEQPRILKVFNYSVVLNMVLVVLTVILMKVRDKTSVPPSWIVKINDLVFGSHLKCFVWPRWHVIHTDSSVKVVAVWIGFANIVNTLIFFATVSVYSILLPVLIPTRAAFN